AEKVGLPVPEQTAGNAISALNDILTDWAKLVNPKPLVVLFDEVDVLVDDALISFLRQLRGGFASRGVGRFPVSIALVGMRDLKDYIIKAKDGKPVNPGSPFNIKADSAVIGNFGREAIARLFAQRTEETGQPITAEALNYVWEQSKGQPWLVNSMLMRAPMRILDEDSTETVTIEHIRQAREQMIQARETHLDALGERLRDPRVKHVVQTIMTGDTDPLMGRTNPDVEFAMDLGLITWNTNTGFTISNPVYEEILMRFLNSGYHDNMPVSSWEWKWQNADGTLDMDGLLHEFQAFWQNNSEVWEERADYTEIFPHLLLMAFLQRITNGSGRIEREYAAGSGRMDLAVEYGGKWDVIEIKLVRHRQQYDAVKATGLRQILSYRDRFSPIPRLPEGVVPDCYLVIFDRRPETKELPWSERISWSREGGVTVVGC
ncbi:MAG: hypothetical protein LBR08_10930, partial [Bacteroidales bacterium]|nr:hypothetical protein [Bacteroidales bacterium]